MRDYGKVSPQFWVGATGRKLRGNAEAQIVALYLMTSPHANMIGVFYCPLEYIAKETGLPLEGASKGLQCLIEADFCTYEGESEYIFVHQFAANQVGEELKPSDKRVQGIMNELAKVPKGQCWQAFRARYAVLYNLPIEGQKDKPLGSPSEAPSKPEAGTEAEAEVKKPRARQTSLPDGFGISDRVKQWADGKGYSPADLNSNLEAFLSYVRRKAPKYADWDEALMTAVRDDWAKARKPGAVAALSERFV
jgi:hypothetical protein